jgi:hypothetical protein
VIAYIIAIVVVAFIFDFINGFHDSANSIATIVGTRVLKPLQAVLWAATFNFAAAFFVGTKVASTLADGILDVNIVFWAPSSGISSPGMRGCRRAPRTRSSADTPAPASPKQGWQRLPGASSGS